MSQGPEPLQPWRVLRLQSHVPVIQRTPKPLGAPAGPRGLPWRAGLAQTWPASPVHGMPQRETRLSGTAPISGNLLAQAAGQSRDRRQTPTEHRSQHRRHPGPQSRGPFWNRQPFNIDASYRAHHVTKKVRGLSKQRPFYSLSLTKCGSSHFVRKFCCCIQ